MHIQFLYTRAPRPSRNESGKRRPSHTTEPREHLEVRVENREPAFLPQLNRSQMSLYTSSNPFALLGTSNDFCVPRVPFFTAAPDPPCLLQATTMHRPWLRPSRSLRPPRFKPRRLSASPPTRTVARLARSLRLTVTPPQRTPLRAENPRRTVVSILHIFPLPDACSPSRRNGDCTGVGDVGRNYSGSSADSCVRRKLGCSGWCSGTWRSPWRTRCLEPSLERRYLPRR